MSIRTQVWAADIAANMFRNNMWIRRSRNDDAFVDNHKVILPQAGTKPNVERNRAVLPASITQRTDTPREYELQEFTSDPTLITDIDAIEVSYDKRANVLSEHIDTLNDSTGDYFAYRWAPTAAALILPHSGTSNRPTAAPGGSGDRKRLTKEDIMQAKSILDSQDIPQEGRVMLLNSVAYNDLLRDTTILSSDYMNQGNLPTGVVTRLLGFDIYIRSLVGRYASGSDTPKDPAAANATTDNAFSLLWHPRFVHAALGAVKVYADEDKPEYYGSVFSAMVRAGGMTRYTNQRGIVAIREVAP